jgi:sugar/nucleoside kinase (ribokinase family)
VDDVERRHPDVVSVLTGAIHLVAEDVRKLTEAVQLKAKEATDVESHIQKVGQGVAAVGNAATAAASAAANDAKKGAEAGISKGLDTAKNAADLKGHFAQLEGTGNWRDPAQGAPLGASMYMSAPRVHVIGNSVCDVMVKSGNIGKGRASDSFSGDNVEMIAEPITPVLGGGGAASAYVLAKLGARVRLHTNLGGDAFGEMLRVWLREAGVREASSCAAATATHVIHTQGSKRRSTYFRGDKVRWKDALLDLKEWREGDWCLAAGYGAVDQDDLAELLEVAHKLRERNCLLAFDPSPWFAGRVDKQQMLALWREVDVLSGTEEELKHWLATKARKLDALEKKLFEIARSPAKPPASLEPSSAGEGSGSATSTASSTRPENQAGEALAKECLAQCPRAMLVVVKRSAQGASWAAPQVPHLPRHKGDAASSAANSMECGSVAARACEGSSVGAGDTFNAQLIFALASGLTARAAVEAAVARASRVVKHGLGAMGAMGAASLSGSSDGMQGMEGEEAVRDDALETSLS